MNNCFECDKTTEIKKYKAFHYTGVNLENIFLLNVEVEFCPHCQTMTPLLRNVGKIHNAIGTAIALQKVQMSGPDLRFLRRSAGYKSGAWAELIGVADAHYSRLENDDRPITAQIDKLSRILFLSSLKQKDPENVKLAQNLEVVLGLNIEPRKEFVIGIDAVAPDKEVRYLPTDSPLLTEPAASVIEAQTIRASPLVVGWIGTKPFSAVLKQELAQGV